MKQIYIIGRTMGVGKTSVYQELKRKLDNSVFLDGDWCWNMHPFQVTDETKTMVTDNICHLLNNFIKCSAYENIIFCWVMHEQNIIDSIVSRLDVQDCDVKIISLICSADVLRKRLQKDINNGIRTADVIERSVVRLPLYDVLNTIKIDVSDISIAQAAARIIAL